MASDLAVHGLAYLGVLLLFTGIFGLIVFAFGDVGEAWRPLAEVAAPAGLFGAAWILRRRGVRFVADALVVLAGAVVPVVFVASLSDGAEIPRDLDGMALVTALTAGCLAVASGYALATAKNADSMLRFLIAPLVWIAVAMAALATVDPIPTGRDVATPHPGQMCLVALPIVATALLCRRWPRSRLARDVQAVSVVGYSVVYILGLLATAAEGWPPVPLAVTGVAGVVLAEVVAYRLDARVVGFAQAILVALAIAPFTPTLGTATAAALGTVAEIAVAEWTGWRRPSDVASALTIVGALLLLVASLDEPWPALVAGTVTWAWILLRRARRPDWLRTVSDDAWLVFAALLPALPASRLFLLAEPDVALLILAIVTSSIAIGARLFASADDVLWKWWPRAALIAVGVGTGVVSPDVTAVLVATSIVVVVGLALAPGPFIVLFWSTAAGAIWAALLSAAFVGAPVATVAVVFGVVGLAFVGVSNLDKVGVHFGLLGHLIGLATIVGMTSGGWSAVAVAALFATEWMLTLGRQERGRSQVIDAVMRSAEQSANTTMQSAVPWVPPAMTAGGVLLTVSTTVAAAELAYSWWAPVAAVTGAVACLFARLVAARPRTSSVFAVTGLVTSVIAVGMLQGGTGRVTLTLTAAIAAGVALPGRVRHPLVLWWLWAIFAAWSLSVAALLGLAREHNFAVILLWGAAVLLATMFVDARRNGRRVTGQWVRTSTLVAPSVLGVGAVGLGLAATFARTPHVFGSWSIVVAAVALVLALQLRAGLVTVATYALVGVGLGAWLPFNALEVPWTIVGFAGVLVVWSGAMRRTPSDGSTLGRWDTAPMFVASTSLVVALAASTVSDQVVATFLAAALVVAAVTIVEREPRWLVVSNLLALVGLGALGPGWFTVGFALTSIAATAVAMKVRRSDRIAFQWASVVTACASWGELLVWLDASARNATVATTLLGGMVAFSLAAAVRWLGLTTEWALPWLTAVVLGIGVGADAAISMDSGGLRDDALLALSVALLLTALGTALVAGRLGQPWLRMATVGLVAVSANTFGLGWEATVEEVAWSAMVAGLAATLVVLSLVAMRPSSPWIQPWLAASALATAAAGTAAFVGLQSDDLESYVAIGALVTAAVEAAALGTAVRSTELLAMSPLLACAGWLVFASDTLAGEPMWFGMPIGLALLIDTGLIRWRRRTDGEPVVTPTLVVMDDVGMAFLFGTPLLEAMVIDSLYALVGVSTGGGIVVWGVVTKVRRRVFAGALAVALGSLLLIGLPLVPLLPRTTGPVAWTLIAAAGAVMIAIAASLEHGKARLHHGIAHLESLMRDWE